MRSASHHLYPPTACIRYPTSIPLTCPQIVAVNSLPLQQRLLVSTWRKSARHLQAPSPLVFNLPTTHYLARHLLQQLLHQQRDYTPTSAPSPQELRSVHITATSHHSPLQNEFADRQLLQSRLLANPKQFRRDSLQIVQGHLQYPPHT